MSWNAFDVSSPANVNTRICNSVDEFLLALTKNPVELVERANRAPPKLIYRGQGDALWGLVPSAFRASPDGSLGSREFWKISSAARSNWKPKTSEQISRPGNPAGTAWRIAELELISTFYRHAEHAGLLLPPVSQEVHRELLFRKPGALSAAVWQSNLVDPNPRNQRRLEWPVTELLPVMALAQHYGLPTRLLDWSWSPFVAAYFAASGHIASPETVNSKAGKYISVWATVSDQLGTPISDERTHGQVPGDKAKKLFMIQTPSAQNPNLKLQRGVFTLFIDEVASQRTAGSDNVSPTVLSPQNEWCPQDKPQFFKLLLPVEKAPELVRRLVSLGYNRNRLIDGFQGAAESVLEEANLAFCR